MAHDAQLRAGRGEGIIADLGLGIGDGVDEGRFARIGQADQPGISKQLQSQPDPRLLARPAGAVLARGAVGRCLVARIAAPAVTAAHEHAPFPRYGEIGKDVLLVLAEHLGADGHANDKVFATRAGAVAARATLAARGTEVLGVAKVDQGVEAGHRFEDDVAALAAIAAVWPSIFDKLFAPERDRAWPARARAYIYLGLIEEMHRRYLARCRRFASAARSQVVSAVRRWASCRVASSRAVPRASPSALAIGPPSSASPSAISTSVSVSSCSVSGLT